MMAHQMQLLSVRGTFKVQEPNQSHGINRYNMQNEQERERELREIKRQRDIFLIHTHMYIYMYMYEMYIEPLCFLQMAYTN